MTRAVTMLDETPGTESRYSDEVYTIKKNNGKSITLYNDEFHNRSSLLIVPKSTISDNKNIIVKINKHIKEERFLKSEGVDVSNILETKRRSFKIINNTYLSTYLKTLIVLLFLVVILKMN